MTVITAKENGFRVPTIDVAPYVRDPASGAARKVVAQVREACMTIGFFELVGHGIERGLQDRIFEAGRRLFALPREEKEKMDRISSGLNNRGYELMGTQVLQQGAGADQKEGFYISQDFPPDHPKVKLHPGFIGPNIWPPTSLIADSVFKDPCESYYKKMLDLCALILQILAAGLPYGPHLFDEFNSNDPLAALRLLRYPPTAAASLGAGAHTDFGAFTLLLQDEHAGLQVQDPKTKSWIDIPPNREAYVVNIGDMMQRWTRGLYKSNLHRVINAGNEERFSVPFFFDGNLDCRLVPFDGDEDRSEREGWGRAMTVEDHMRDRFASTYVKT